MGILDTLRNRIETGCEGDYVVVTDDEFEELLTALDVARPQIDQGDGAGRPIVMYGRKIVAPDGSTRVSRKPGSTASAAQRCEWDRTEPFSYLKPCYRCALAVPRALRPSCPVRALVARDRESADRVRELEAAITEWAEARREPSGPESDDPVRLKVLAAVGRLDVLVAGPPAVPSRRDLEDALVLAADGKDDGLLNVVRLATAILRSRRSGHPTIDGDRFKSCAVWRFRPGRDVVCTGVCSERQRGACRDASEHGLPADPSTAERPNGRTNQSTEGREKC